MPHLRYDEDDAIACITLANPPQNRLSPEMIMDFEAALERLGESSARCLLVCADGNDFSFGGDIVPWNYMEFRELRSLFDRYMAAFNRFERLGIPTVAAVQGLCFGGGLELAIRSDVIFAGETSRFGHPEQSLGIVTLLGGIYRVAERAGRSKAMEWALTSTQVPAAEMERHGVVNRVVPDADLREAATEFARTVARGPTRAHAVHKTLLRIWATGGTAAADEAMWESAMPLFETRDTRLALPASIEAFKAGRPRPNFDFQGS